MSIELKQAAQQAVDAFHSFGDADDFASLFELTQKVRALRTAIQQAEAQQPAAPEPVGFTYQAEIEYANSTGGNGSFWHAPPDFDDESVPLYTHPAANVPEFSRIAKRKLDELQKQGFGITGYAIQRGTQHGFITNAGFVGWWRSDEAPSVPDDSKRLDYLQDRGATIDLIAGVADFYPMRFRVGGLHSSANIDVRAAIDAAMLAAK